MAGLDSIRHFQAGGSTNAETDADTTAEKDTSGGALPGGGSLKVGNQTIKTSGPIASAELLKAMQEEYDRRSPDSGLGRFNTFLEGMKDAVAITSRDPGSAMAARDAEKRAQQESLFNMRAGIASLRGQQQQNELLGRSLDTQIGGAGTGTGGFGGAGGAGGSGQMPDFLMKQAAAKRVLGDNAGAQAIIDNWTKEVGKNEAQSQFRAESLTQKEYELPDGTYQKMDANQWSEFKRTGNLPNGKKVSQDVVQETKPVTAAPTAQVSGTKNNNPGNIRFGDFARSQGATGSVDGTPNGIAVFPNLENGSKAQHELLNGSLYGNKPLKDVPSTWAPKGDGANDPAAYTKGLQSITGFDDATMSKSYRQLTPEQQKTFRDAQTRMEHGAGSTSVQPSATTNTVPAFVPPKRVQGESDETYKSRMAQAEKLYESQIRLSEAGPKTASEEQAKLAEKRRTDFEAITEPYTVDQQRSNAASIAKKVSENPKIAGVFSDPGFVNAAGALLKNGVELGRFGTLSINLEDAYLQAFDRKYGKADTVTRAEVKQMFANIELAKSTILKGQGPVSDNERAILQRAAGSISDPAEVVVKTAKAIALASEFRQKSRDMYDANRDSYKDFSKFEGSKEYKKLVNEYGEKADQLHNEKISLGKSAPKSSGYEDAEKEKRYQDYLKNRKAK